jgi:hypothetical protein
LFVLLSDAKYLSFRPLISQVQFPIAQIIFRPRFHCSPGIESYYLS